MKHYMFGFRKDSPDETGFLRLTKDGYDVVKDVSAATGFDRDYSEFFNGEDEISAWRFHSVRYNIG